MIRKMCIIDECLNFSENRIGAKLFVTHFKEENISSPDLNLSFGGKLALKALLKVFFINTSRIIVANHFFSAIFSWSTTILYTLHIAEGVSKC